SFLVGSAAVASTVIPLLDCQGCVASSGVRTYRWTQLPGGPGWDNVAGHLDVMVGNQTVDDGQCVPEDPQDPENENCVEDPDDDCHAKQVATINSGGALHRFSHGASGCLEWDDLSDEQKVLTAESRDC